MQNHKAYTRLAPFYNSLMSHINYEGWAAYIAEILLHYIPSNARVLEIAAGTGSVSKYLGTVFPKLVVSEFSREMLLMAGKKRPRVACDMTALPFKANFNAVYSTFDSVNYLTSKSALKKALAQSCSVLRKEGIFCFDVSLENNSRKYLSYVNSELELPEQIVSQRSWYNPKSRFHYNKFYFYELNGRVSAETHKQKIFPFITYFETAERTGFSVLKCYKAFTFRKGKKTDDRVLFVLRKD